MHAPGDTDRHRLVSLCTVRSRWLSRRAIGVHLTAIIVIPVFLRLGWWQLQRALSGNSLSWAYTFEWPIFAGYAVYMWWKLIHDFDLASAPASSATVAGTSGTDQPKAATSDDERLASYNRYLTALNRQAASQSRSRRGSAEPPRSEEATVE
jgi:hypothetical protein